MLRKKSTELCRLDLDLILDCSSYLAELITLLPLNSSFIPPKNVATAATRIVLRYHNTDIIKMPTSATSSEAYILCSEKKSTELRRLDLDLILDCSSYSADLIIILRLNSA